MDHDKVVQAIEVLSGIAATNSSADTSTPRSEQRRGVHGPGKMHVLFITV